MRPTKEQTLANPKKVMLHDLALLREYARQVILQKEALTHNEDFKERLLQEFLAMGNSLKLTERDLVVLLYRGLKEGPHEKC